MYKLLNSLVHKGSKPPCPIIEVECTEQSKPDDRVKLMRGIECLCRKF